MVYFKKLFFFKVLKFLAERQIIFLEIKECFQMNRKFNYFWVAQTRFH